MSRAYPQPVPDPRDTDDTRWLPPADADVVNETHRFERDPLGPFYLSMYDATGEFAGEAWIESDTFVPLDAML